MMTSRGSITFATALMAALLVVAPRALAGQAVTFANGITATIHGADEIAAAAVADRDGRPVYTHPAIGALALAADGAWYPFDAAVVSDALEAMRGFATDVAVEVFILPAPTAALASSYAVPGAIVLAPGTGPVAAQTVAYITTHEMGHVLTSAFIDGQAGRWDAYLALRSLDEVTYSADAIHADRPREILAEDIRFLFGGDLATANGSIENHDLLRPDLVPGLAEQLAGFLAGRDAAGALAASTAWPNPCNPLTTIAMELPAGALGAGRAELRIYDVRGGLVRTLQGGVEAGGQVSIQWRGDTDAGAAAASGRYLYLMRAAGATARGSVTLVR